MPPYYKHSSGKPFSKSTAKSTAKPPAKPSGKPSSKAAADMVRLNKRLADSGVCSRREADRFIEEGLVKVNGKVITTLGAQIKVTDKVMVKGNPLPEKTRNIYLLFHKPTGCMTTRSDEKQRETIYAHLPQYYHTLDPAGRLDKNSSGALILSNDGEFIYKLTHPKFHMEKVYRVTLTRPVVKPAELQKKLLAGIDIDETTGKGEVKLATAARVEFEASDTLLLTLTTGYNRQIRRMFTILGYEVSKLKRTSIGPVSLKDLAPGKTRPLDRIELQRLNLAFSGKGKPATKTGEKPGGKKFGKKPTSQPATSPSVYENAAPKRGAAKPVTTPKRTEKASARISEKRLIAPDLKPSKRRATLFKKTQVKPAVKPSVKQSGKPGGKPGVKPGRTPGGKTVSKSE